ncbi:hypothetical protein LJC28_04835, partial [Dysgonomonas sp. OttesenSCG-928-D17]|nr:hypothetical protein [Dysgonomonas sp. OttesenSCG-928-D17]
TSMADRAANNTTNYTAKNVGFNISRKPGVSKSIYSENGIFNFTGRISELIEYMTDCSSWQVSLQNMNDYEVAMTCSENEMATDKNKILERISGALRLDIRSQSKTIEGTIVEVANAKRLWNDEQISWGAENSQGYIIGSDRIDADNITIRQVANLLSDVKKTFFYYGGQDTQLHDWSFHYLYDNLMEEDLLYNFGIKLKKGKIRVPSYMVSPM